MTSTGNPQVNTCFVIMPFGAPFDQYYEEVLVPSIIAADLKPIRADEINKPGVIMNQIWEGIISAQVCLADVTGRNANVMYELGLAHANGKPVVQLVQNPDDLPFDLRAYRHIVYRTISPDWATSLKDQVTEMLLETISNPTSALVFPRAGGFRHLRVGPKLGGSAETIFSIGDEPITWTQARRILRSLPEEDYARLMEIACIIDLHGASGNLNEAAALISRLKTGFSSSVFVPAEAAEVIVKTATEILNSYPPLEGGDSDAKHYYGYGKVSAILKGVLHLLPRLHQCFDCVLDYSETVAASFLINEYFSDDHYWNYRTKMRILDVLLQADLGKRPLIVFEDILSSRNPSGREFLKTVRVARALLQNEFDSWYENVRGKAQGDETK